MKYVVCNVNKAGEEIGLKGTVFALDLDRAIRHDTLEAAQSAKENAAKFYPKRYYARTYIKEIQE